MITSVQNPLVKQIRQLHQAKYRHRAQKILLEGTHLLLEAWATDYPLDCVCHTQAWADKNTIFYGELQKRGTRCEVVTDAVLQALATTQTPDGIVAVADYPRFKPLTLQSLGLVLVGIQDPGNLGTIVRTAAAIPVDGIILGPGCVDLTHPKVLRATAGQWFRLPLCVCEDVGAWLTRLKPEANWQIIATTPHGTAQAYWDLDYRQPTIFLLGSEGQGLAPELIAQAPHCIYIPQAPDVESLNVAIASALLLYEVKRQRWPGM